MEYLAQSVTCDGNIGTQLQQTAPIFCRRQDFGGFQDEDAFLMPDGSAILTWSYPPFGPFVAANGDGGEHYIYNGQTVRIDSTQDGGKPGVQYFTGAQCGGTGWIAFRNDATPSWSALTATLSDQASATNCSASSSAYTRYETAIVTYPFSTGGQAIQSIVGEHYNSGSMGSATAMERSFWARGWGRLVWQAFGTNPSPFGDLATRCQDFGWNTPPVSGWYLEDCREVVNISPADGSLTGAMEWHP